MFSSISMTRTEETTYQHIRLGYNRSVFTRITSSKQVRCKTSGGKPELAMLKDLCCKRVVVAYGEQYFQTPFSEIIVQLAVIFTGHQRPIKGCATCSFSPLLISHKSSCSAASSI
jgi:hypothetical protein